MRYLFLMKNPSLTKLTRRTSSIFIWVFVLILILNIIGLIYQGKRNAAFIEANPDGGSNLGIFIGAYLMIELYMLVMLCWTWLVSQMKKLQWLKLLQLIILFCIGIIPGIYLAIGVFLKK